MAPENLNKPGAAVTPEDTKEMEKYGVIRIPVDYFWLGEFRYTSFKDAIAQAKREEHLRADDEGMIVRSD